MTGKKGKNRVLQRPPPEDAQRHAIRQQTVPGGSYRFTVRDITSFNAADYGILRTQLELIRLADDFAPASRGPKPKRETLLQVLDVLEEARMPIRTGRLSSPVIKHVADKIGRSPAQARDLLHQLADMLERLHPLK